MQSIQEYIKQLQKRLEKMSHDYLGLEDTLDKDDYGFILDKDGNLKGIWIPPRSRRRRCPRRYRAIGKRKMGN